MVGALLYDLTRLSCYLHKLDKAAVCSQHTL